MAQSQNLVECNRCKDAGFPEQKITFVNSGKKKADGKIFWNLLNEDYSMHVHKSPTEKFEQVEQMQMDKPAARPPMHDTPVTDPTLIQAIAQLTDATKLVALALVCSNPEEKESIRQRCLM